MLCYGEVKGVPQEWFTTLLLANSPSHWSTAHLSCITLTLTTKTPSYWSTSAPRLKTLLLA